MDTTPKFTAGDNVLAFNDGGEPEDINPFANLVFVTVLFVLPPRTPFEGITWEQEYIVLGREGDWFIADERNLFLDREDYLDKEIKRTNEAMVDLQKYQKTLMHHKV
jgi:hypothetical protein